MLRRLGAGRHAISGGTDGAEPTIRTRRARAGKLASPGPGRGRCPRSRPSAAWSWRTSRAGSAARWWRLREGRGDAGGPARQAAGVPAPPAAFLLDGQRVTLVRPRPGDRDAPAGTGQRTASGSVAAPRQRAKVAKASRIYVEGKHDAELVEKIWGDDLRDVGVVVEYLEGVDDLPAIVDEFRRSRGRGSASSSTTSSPAPRRAGSPPAVRDPDVLVVGHPFIDIWAAVKPAAVGLAAWPDVPRGQPWKEGVLRRIGWPPEVPCGLAADPARGQQLRRPGAGTARPGRGADRLRDHARGVRDRPGNE